MLFRQVALACGSTSPSIKQDITGRDTRRFSLDFLDRRARLKLVDPLGVIHFRRTNQNLEGSVFILAQEEGKKI